MNGSHGQGDGMLHEQLAHDSSGALRDQLLDELAIAAQDIETALRTQPPMARAKVLSDLLSAIEESERVISEVWESSHASHALMLPA